MIEISNSLVEIFKSNQLLATATGVYGAGVLTFLLRNIPSKIIEFLKRHLTTTMTITSQNNIFHDTMKWFEREFKNKNFRTIKLSNGKYGYGEKTVKSLGYGHHYFWWNKQLFLINLKKEEGNKTEYDKDTLTITKLGRNHKVFNTLIERFVKVEKDITKTEVYKFDNEWNFAREQFKRAFDSVFLEDYKKDKIIKTLENFRNREDWYIKNGIPYQLGILLYGSPGTGKSSLIKALASHLDYKTYYIDSKSLHKLPSAISSLPNNVLLVIEDIDTNSVTHTRKGDNKFEKPFNLDELNDLSLSTILNSLDGFFSSHGRILIATTNHIKKLDPALIRAGRIDLKVEVGYVNKEILKQFIDNFFPNNNYDLKSLNIKENITVAELQNMALEDFKIEDIIKRINK